MKKEFTPDIRSVKYVVKPEIGSRRSVLGSVSILDESMSGFVPDKKVHNGYVISVSDDGTYRLCKSRYESEENCSRCNPKLYSCKFPFKQS